MITTSKKKLAFATAAVIGMLALAGCSAQGQAAGGSSGGGGKKIGFLLPETAVPRYEGQDKPFFEAKMKELCPDCTVLYANADSDASKQQQQAQSMLTQGVNVLVVDPFDGVAAASIVESAAAQNVPVVAYDRLIQSSKTSYLISNDYEKVGELQAQALIEKLKKDNVDPSSGGIVALNGAATDFNAGNIKKGADKVLNDSGFQILNSIDTWDPTEAQNFTAGQITKYGKKIVGVYSANDGNAGGAIAAFKAAGLQTPPTTGLDASIAGLQNILAGNQYQTVYNSFKGEADTAAEVAYKLAQGKKVTSDTKVKGVPASLQEPVSVTIDNIASTVIKDKVYKVSEICTTQYAADCAKAGIN